MLVKGLKLLFYFINGKNFFTNIFSIKCFFEHHIFINFFLSLFLPPFLPSLPFHSSSLFLIFFFLFSFPFFLFLFSLPFFLFLFSFPFFSFPIFCFPFFSFQIMEFFIEFYNKNKNFPHYASNIIYFMFNFFFSMLVPTILEHIRWDLFMDTGQNPGPVVEELGLTLVVLEGPIEDKKPQKLNIFA